MRIRPRIFAVLVIAIMFFTSCTAKTAQSNTGFSKVQPTSPSEISENATNGDAGDSAMVWEQTLEFGKLIFSIDSAQVITDVSEIGEGSFGEHSEIAFYDGTFYEQAMSNWREYGSKYETIYNYPEYIDSNGIFMDGAYMIALDITVESQDATNQWTNTTTGTVETRYGNPYLFKADSLLYLIDKGVQTSDGEYIGASAGFFSGYGIYAEHPLAYELKPGETISFRIGFLIGNRPDGTNRILSDLVVSTQNNSLEEAVWFNLNLEDIQ